MLIENFLSPVVGDVYPNVTSQPVWRNRFWFMGKMKKEWMDFYYFRVVVLTQLTQNYAKEWFIHKSGIASFDSKQLIENTWLDMTHDSCCHDFHYLWQMRVISQIMVYGSGDWLIDGQVLCKVSFLSFFFRRPCIPMDNI